MRVELPLLGFFASIWGLALLAATGVFQTHSLFQISLDLHIYYSIAAVLGWLGGNAYVSRKREVEDKRLLIATYFAGPPALVFLLYGFFPTQFQADYPFVQVWALCVYAVFYYVPLSIRRR